jgi:hypothetical protein
VKNAAQQLARSLRDLISGIRVRYEGVEVGYDARERPPAPRRLDDELREAFFEVGELTADSHRRGVIVRYDEFYVVEEKKGTTSISALLSALAAAQQQRLPIIFVLCGLPR